LARTLNVRDGRQRSAKYKKKEDLDPGGSSENQITLLLIRRTHILSEFHYLSTVLAFVSGWPAFTLRLHQRLEPRDYVGF